MAPGAVLRSNGRASTSVSNMGRAVAAGFTDVYRELVESLDAIFWEADPQTLRFSSVSPKAEALLGYPQLAWTSKPTFGGDMIHPDDRNRILVMRVPAIKRCKD